MKGIVLINKFGKYVRVNRVTEHTCHATMVTDINEASVFDDIDLTQNWYKDFIDDGCQELKANLTRKVRLQHED